MEVGQLYLQQRELVLFAERKFPRKAFANHLPSVCTFDEKLEEGRKPLLCFWFSYPPHK
jgi:hypothetical protein